MLKDKLKEDFKIAMRTKNAYMKLAISDIRGAIQYAETRKGRDTEVNDQEIITIINKCVKECKESIESFKTAGYDANITEQEAKLVIFQEYLPEEASTETILEVIDEAILKIGATSMADMGKVMGTARKKLIEKGLNFSGGILADNVKMKLG